MNVTTLIRTLEIIAPPQYAATWDNTGLLLGDRGWSAERVLLTIDLTEPVLEEAIGGGVNAIVAYHPLIFRPISALTGDETQTRIALGAARAGIAIYSPHTALDAAPGGVNDWLAESLGAGDVRAVETFAALPPGEACKLITFCPPDAADAVRNALASIGAGRIGDYEVCSFQSGGIGTFLGGEGTQPSVGRAGRLERVEEVRLEMVCPADSLALAVAALRQFHPYEEPPIEIYAQQPRPLRSVGHGRRITLDRKVDLKTLCARIRKVLGVDEVRVAIGRPAPRRFGTIGLCPGAGGSIAAPAIEQGCEAFLTGEMRHHDVLAAQARGCTIILAGHTNTERGYLKVLRSKLQEAHPQMTVVLSRKDVDPLRIM